MPACCVVQGGLPERYRPGLSTQCVAHHITAPEEQLLALIIRAVCENYRPVERTNARHVCRPQFGWNKRFRCHLVRGVQAALPFQWHLNLGAKYRPHQNLQKFHQCPSDTRPQAMRTTAVSPPHRATSPLVHPHCPTRYKQFADMSQRDHNCEHTATSPGLEETGAIATEWQQMGYLIRLGYRNIGYCMT